MSSVLAAGVLPAAISISPSSAQRAPRPGLAPLPDKPALGFLLGFLGERINTSTISIVSGNISAAWLTIACDLSAVLDRGDDFRNLPVARLGGELGNIDKIASTTRLFNQTLRVPVSVSDAGSATRLNDSSSKGV